MEGHNSGSGTAGRVFVGTPVGRSALGVTIRQSLDGKWMGENSSMGLVICTPSTGTLSIRVRGKVVWYSVVTL